MQGGSIHQKTIYVIGGAALLLSTLCGLGFATVSEQLEEIKLSTQFRLIQTEKNLHTEKAVNEILTILKQQSEDYAVVKESVIRIEERMNATWPTSKAD